MAHYSILHDSKQLYAAKDVLIAALKSKLRLAEYILKQQNIL